MYVWRIYVCGYACMYVPGRRYMVTNPRNSSYPVKADRAARSALIVERVIAVCMRGFPRCIYKSRSWWLTKMWLNPTVSCGGIEKRTYMVSWIQHVSYEIRLEAKKWFTWNRVAFISKLEDGMLVAMNYFWVEILHSHPSLSLKIVARNYAC